MPTESLCQTCGAPLSPAADGRLRCPACLLLIGLSDATLEPAAMDELVPGSAAIGPYLVLKRLGEGGMGEVFLAEQQHPIQRTVAVKVLKPGAIDRRAAARFEFERQALAILNHHAIAKVFDAGFAADGCGRTWRWNTCPDLADEIRRRGTPAYGGSSRAVG